MTTSRGPYTAKIETSARFRRTTWDTLCDIAQRSGTTKTAVLEYAVLRYAERVQADPKAFSRKGQAGGRSRKTDLVLDPVAAAEAAAADEAVAGETGAADSAHA